VQGDRGGGGAEEEEEDEKHGGLVLAAPRRTSVPLSGVRARGQKALSKATSPPTGSRA